MCSPDRSEPWFLLVFGAFVEHCDLFIYIIKNERLNIRRNRISERNKSLLDLPDEIGDLFRKIFECKFYILRIFSNFARICITALSENFKKKSV